MDSIINIIGSVKDSIILVMEQLNAVQKIQEIGIRKLPLYKETIDSLQTSILNLERVFENDIPIQHKLKRLVILSLKIDLDEFQNTLGDCINWYNHVIEIDENKYSKRLNNIFYQCTHFNICSIHLILELPTELLAELESIFIIIQEKIQDVITLEKTIFGAAIAIKHPLLQKTWINCGFNQLNDTEIPCSIIIESLYDMFVDEEGGKLKNEKVCIELITNYVHYIDSLSGTSPNGMISVSEFNKVPMNDQNLYTVKGLLGIEEQPDFEEEEIVDNKELYINDEIQIRFKENGSFLLNKEKYAEYIIQFVNQMKSVTNENKKKDTIIQSEESEESEKIENHIITKKEENIDSNEEKLKSVLENNLNLDINFDKKIIIGYNHPIEIPLCEGYGSKWPSICAYEIKIPQYEKKIGHKVFCGIKLKIVAADQGWGGTGHNNVRYQINNGDLTTGFYIDRNKNKSGEYKIDIPPNQLQPNSLIKVWLICAPWSGWEASISNITGKLKYN